MHDLWENVRIFSTINLKKKTTFMLLILLLLSFSTRPNPVYLQPCRKKTKSLWMNYLCTTLDRFQMLQLLRRVEHLSNNWRKKNSHNCSGKLYDESIVLSTDSDIYWLNCTKSVFQSSFELGGIKSRVTQSEKLKLSLFEKEHSLISNRTAEPHMYNCLKFSFGWSNPFRYLWRLKHKSPTESYHFNIRIRWWIPGNVLGCLPWHGHIWFNTTQQYSFIFRYHKV